VSRKFPSVNNSLTLFLLRLRVFCSWLNERLSSKVTRTKQDCAIALPQRDGKYLPVRRALKRTGDEGRSRVYEFPKITEYSVPPYRVLAEPQLRTVLRKVRSQMKTDARVDQAPKFPVVLPILLPVLRSQYRVPIVLRTSEFSNRASSISASSCVASRFVEVRSVSASSVQCMLRQAFGRVAVPRSRPAGLVAARFVASSSVASSSVAFSVKTSPTFSASQPLGPKRILSSALQSSVRAARAEKCLRISRRLATLGSQR
jgi:hypothetical protein